MRAQVVVIGAGYAGASAAKRLCRGSAHTTASVTVVNPRADFVERIRLHQLIVGNHAATRPVTSMLPGAARFVQDSVESNCPAWPRTPAWRSTRAGR
jgi:NADH dehydrogenase